MKIQSSGSDFHKSNWLQLPISRRPNQITVLGHPANHFQIDYPPPPGAYNEISSPLLLRSNPTITRSLFTAPICHKVARVVCKLIAVNVRGESHWALLRIRLRSMTTTRSFRTDRVVAFVDYTLLLIRTEINRHETAYGGGSHKESRVPTNICFTWIKTVSNPFPHFPRVIIISQIENMDRIAEHMFLQI